MGEKIQLMSSGFREWMEAEEQKITRVKDKLVLLESHERRLSGIWESGASRQWDSGFQKELSEIEHWILGIEELLQKTEESAEVLLQVEKGLIGEAERL